MEKTRFSQEQLKNKKWNVKKIGATALMGLSLLLVGCSQQSPTSVKETEHVKIGILQFAEHDALTSAREGFLESLREAGYKEGDNLTVTLQNAMGDQSQLQSMSEKIAGKQNIHFAIATPAAQGLVNVDAKTPTVFTAVTDPVSAGLVSDVEKPDGNATGTTDLTPVDKQVEKLLSVVPNAKKVGIFYNSSEVNSESQASAAKQFLASKGIEAVEMTVTNTNDVQQVLTSLASHVDAIYFPTDTTVASTISTIKDVLMEKKIPALGGDEAVLKGMLVTYGVDYKEIGKQAGKQAVEILKGKKVSEVPIQQPQNPSIKINKEMAASLGLDIVQLEKALGIE
ncbi:ABC transporter substrate-binding protein [Carnobacteriaceae bacterium zg-ZUI78]|nr:ABC transporter substrate-binding protein [Carnobacteriaceae bacterium zg-ZUI78]